MLISTPPLLISSSSHLLPLLIRMPCICLVSLRARTSGSSEFVGFRLPARISTTGGGAKENNKNGSASKHDDDDESAPFERTALALRAAHTQQRQQFIIGGSLRPSLRSFLGAASNGSVASFVRPSATSLRASKTQVLSSTHEHSPPPTTSTHSPPPSHSRLNYVLNLLPNALVHS